jgi:hypothetical protein
MSFRWSVPVAALVLLGSPAVALGQPAADKATARALALEGQDALEASDYDAAADRFGRALALFHAPTLLVGLARAQRGLGKWIAAQESYNSVLHESLPPDAPQAYLDALQEARREVDELTPKIPSVLVTVRGAPVASVTIDGVPLPSAALGINRPVDPGAHVIRAEAKDCAPAEVRLTVAPAAREVVTLTLEPFHAAGSAGAAGIRRAIGFATLGAGGTGLVLGAVAGGIAVARHDSLAARCPGGRCAGQQDAITGYHFAADLSTAGLVAGGVLAVAGVALVAIPGDTNASSHDWIAPVLGGIGGAGLVFGAVLGVRAVQKYDELAAACPGGRCTGRQQAIADYRVTADLSTTAILTGGALVGTGVLFAVMHRSSGAKVVSIGPVLGAGYAGVKGTF